MRFSILIATVILGSSYTTSSSAAGPTSFPGVAKESRSPDGLYSVLNVDGPDQLGKDPVHHLFFKGKNDAKPVPLNILSTANNSYDRQIDILWSPDSKSLILNDWIGSNVADAFLYRVNDISHPVDIGEKLSRTLLKEHVPLSTANYVYYSGSKWIGPNTAVVKVQISPDRVRLYRWNLRDIFQRETRRHMANSR